MNNPFYIEWLKGWAFQIVLMEGNVKIEAIGFGVKLSSSFLPGESRQIAADRLVLLEDQKRNSLKNSWARNNSTSPRLDTENNPRQKQIAYI